MENTRHYVNTYPCEPGAACYCGSNKPFEKCCASDQIDRDPPHGIRVIPNFLNVTDCRRLVRYAEKQKGHWLMVRDDAKSRPGHHVEKRDKGRVTQQVDMSKHSNFINEHFRLGLQQHAVPFFGSIDWIEWPYMLRYKVGGAYGAHSDAEQFDKAAGRHYKVQDRDVSMLLYLNDDYTGGELSFTRLNYTYKPVAGDMVLFPSSTLFKHRAHTVKTDRKYALVSWSSLSSSPKLFPQTSASPRIKF